MYDRVICRHCIANNLEKNKVEIIKDSNEVDSSKLNGAKAYIQVTYVEPYFEEWELKNKTTVFDKTFNISKMCAVCFIVYYITVYL